MITILTPTYNRAYILTEAFRSLCMQTSFDFEWIIVDDGSTDNTESMVNAWLTESMPFNIKYFKQLNGGKHRAINKGVSLAESDYILILDSDDFLENDAVSFIHKWIKSIEGLDNFAGVAGLRGWKDRNEPIGNNLSTDYIDATNLERKKYHLSGDKAEIYKTEILKKYPFPEFDGENFIRESAVWDRIAMAGYKLRWFNKIIYRCEYQEDGLTKGVNEAVYANNFNGFTYCIKLQILNQKFPYKHLKIGYFSSVAHSKELDDKEILSLLCIRKSELLIGKFIYFLHRIIKK